MGDVAAGIRLEKEPLLGQRFRRHGKGGLGRPANADVIVLADEPLLNDAAALNDTDAENTRFGRSGSAGFRAWGRLLGRHEVVSS